MKKIISTLSISIFAIIFLNSFLKVEKEYWIPKANFGGAGRSSPVYFSIGEMGYVGAGDLSQASFSTKLSNDLWQYDPANDKWTQKANIPVAHSGGDAFSLNGKGYVVVGGWMGKSANSKKEDATEFLQYDPATNKWTKKADLPKGYSSFAFASGTHGYALFYEPNYIKKEKQNVWEYDPSSDTWIKKSGIGMPSGASQFFVIDNIAYFVHSGKKIIYAYDIESGTWTEKLKFKQGCAEDFVYFTYAGKGYFGGEQCSNDAVSLYLYEYDPIKNVVIEKGRLFIGVKFAIALVIGNRVFGGLGQRPIVGKSKDWYEYKPSE